MARYSEENVSPTATMLDLFGSTIRLGNFSFISETLASGLPKVGNEFQLVSRPHRVGVGTMMVELTGGTLTALSVTVYGLQNGTWVSLGVSVTDVAGGSVSFNTEGYDAFRARIDSATVNTGTPLATVSFNFD